MQIWNSRKKLFINIIILTTVAILLRSDLFRAYECLFYSPIPEIDTNSFIADVKEAVEAFDYLYDLQRGKAKVLPVVEKPKILIEYRPCRSKDKISIKSFGWVQNERWYLFSAYLDERYNSLYSNLRSIQILAMTLKEPHQNETFYCHIFAQNGQKSLVQAHLRIIWQTAWDPRKSFYNPYLISCGIPAWMDMNSNFSAAISVYKCPRSDIEAISVNIPLNKTHTLKPSVAVCVKGLDFLEDMSKKLIEWTELNYLLGADMITVYIYYVHPNVYKVLNYYEARGKIKLINITLPGDSPNHSYIRHGYIWRNRQQKRRHELIPYNDCFYRYINSHDFVLIIDTDEIVVPLKHDSWSKMLTSIISESPAKNFTSISIRNVFKFPTMINENSNLYMLNNRRRSKSLLDRESYGKSFISTKNVATVFNHFALHKLHYQMLRTIYADEQLALKLHYKSVCPIESRKECKDLMENTIDDNSLDKFTEELKKRVNIVYKDLNFDE